MSDSMDNGKILEHLIILNGQMSGVQASLRHILAAVDGNGQPGLQQKVASLEKTKNRLVGAWFAVTGLLGLVDWLWTRHWIHR